MDLGYLLVCFACYHAGVADVARRGIHQMVQLDSLWPAMGVLLADQPGAGRRASFSFWLGRCARRVVNAQSLADAGLVAGGDCARLSSLDPAQLRALRPSHSHPLEPAL